ncbi:MAG: hypothetical protein JW720_07980 [Sedimentisphaerales bacterium]|nr:hypothetical protein [Sedimentisphaerales bacterium]
MQKLIIVMLISVIVCSTGCRPNIAGDPKALKVVVSEGGEFPDFLVGVWKCEQYGWEFNFEPDGTVSSVVISLGRVRIKPGEVTEVPMIKGGKGVFTPGEWSVYYTPATRELTANLSLNHLSIVVGDNLLEGKNRDVFLGQISEDGMTWDTVWTSFPDYIASTPENPDFKMREDPNFGIQYNATFEKVPKPTQ